MHEFRRGVRVSAECGCCHTRLRPFTDERSDLTNLRRLGLYSSILLFSVRHPEPLDQDSNRFLCRSTCVCCSSIQPETCRDLVYLVVLTRAKLEPHNRFAPACMLEHTNSGNDLSDSLQTLDQLALSHYSGNKDRTNQPFSQINFQAKQ